ncbi:MAG: hypothetical protein ACK4IY_09070, partial [Chitinophagales bacterium]
MKHFTYCIAILLSCIFSFLQVNAQFESEPNDDIANADTLLLGESIEGASVATFFIVDFFYFEVPGYGNFE